MPMRCAWPPENSCGKQFRCAEAKPTRSSMARTWPRRAMESGPEFAQRFFDDLCDAHARVERGERILEDDLQMFPHGAQGAPLEREKLYAAKTRCARRRRHQAQQRPCDRRFAGTRFPHDTERLTALDGETHSIDRLQPALRTGHGEAHGQIRHGERRRAASGGVGRRRGHCILPSGPS
jgi:hypothetical protein